MKNILCACVVLLLVAPISAQAALGTLNGISTNSQFFSTPNSGASDTLHLDISTIGGDTHQFKWDGSVWRVDQGGTGASMLPVGGILIGAGVGPIQSTYAPVVDSITATSALATSTLKKVELSQLKIGAQSGVLRAVAGYISASLINLTEDVTGILDISHGGTGVSVTPSYGQLMLGNNQGSYDLVSTSSLGITGSIVPGGGTNQIQFNNNGIFAGANSFTFNPINGFLGVGTSTQYYPNEKWEFVTETNGDGGANLYLTDYGNESPFAAFSIRTSGGTMQNPTATLEGHALGRYTFNGHDGERFPRLASAGISGMAEEDWTPTKRGTYIDFLTTAVGTNTRNEKMRITSEGRIAIGTTLPNARLSVFGRTDPITFEASTLGTTTVLVDSRSNAKGSCLKLKDSDGIGYTYLTVNDGVPTFSVTPCN